MGKLTRNLTARGKRVARKAYEKVETRILVEEGRKSMKRKLGTVVKVTKKAAKSALIAGAFAAAGVVSREVRKRRKLTE